MKKYINIVLLLILLSNIVNTVFASNYTYTKTIKYNSKEAYDDYTQKVNDAVYKNMPRSFSYINREPQFAVSIKKDGSVEKAWILVSSGSERYDKKVIKKMENAEFPSYQDYMSAKNLVFRYKIRKQTKIIPIPIPIWF